MSTLATTTSQRRPWWLRLLGWLLVLGLLAVLAIGGAVAYGVWWLGGDEQKVLREVDALNGGSIVFSSIEVADYSAYPNLELRIKNLEVYDPSVRLPDTPDSTSSADHPPTLRLAEAVAYTTADAWDARTLTLDSLTIRGGLLDIVAIGNLGSNLSRLLKRGETAPTRVERDEEGFLRFNPAATLTAEDVDVSFVNAEKENDIGAKFHRLVVSDMVREPSPTAHVTLDAFVDGIEFKERHGAFLRDTPLRGALDIRRDGNKLLASSSGLDIGELLIGVDIEFYPKRDDTSRLMFSVDSTVLAKARPLMSDHVRKQLEPFDVSGVFSTVTTLTSTFVRGDKPVVDVQVGFRGNDARINAVRFADAYLDGRFYNRLSTDPAVYASGQRGIRFEIDTLSTGTNGFDVTTPGALVTARVGEAARVRGPARVSGPASAVSTVLKNDQFLFVGGQMVADMHFVGPPNRMVELIEDSEGTIQFIKPILRIVEAGARVPLSRIDVEKRGPRTAFNVSGITPYERRPYALEGELTNLATLLRAEDTRPVTTNVKLSAGRINWQDVLELLGDDAAAAFAKTEGAQVIEMGGKGGGKGTPVEADELQLEVPTASGAARAAAAKRTLQLVQRTFSPEVEIAVDTLGYYDIAEVRMFRTGAHFEADTALVLKRTSFVVDSGRVGFGGSIKLNEQGRTPFAYSLEAHHLNLAELVPMMDYFAVDLLREVPIWPNDVNVDVSHRGWVDDELGLLANASEGSIELKSNQIRPFSASVDFEPEHLSDTLFKSTHVELAGSPELFNDFFQTEDFFFRHGSFEFAVGYSGLVPDLRTLLDQEEMRLHVNCVDVLFERSDVTFPVADLMLEMDKDVADVRLLIRDDSLEQEIFVSGYVEAVSEVVLGDTGKRFSADVDVSSPRLNWRDLNGLIGAMAVDTTAAKDAETPLGIRKTVRELMLKFDPNVRLSIDELKLNHAITVTELTSGLRMDTAQVLHIGTTGFAFEGGTMALSGKLALKDLRETPFAVNLATESLDVARLLRGFDYFGMSQLEEAEQIDGRLSMLLVAEGAVTGGQAVRGKPASIVRDATKGTLELGFDELRVMGMPALDTLGDRFKVGKRTDDIRLAPLRTTLVLDGQQITVPLTEIQSNAFNLFVEGELNLGDAPSELWVSVPVMANLFGRDLAVIPALQGYAGSRLKAHIVLGMDTTGVQPKLRLSRKKYYDTRGGRRAWRKAKRAWRAERRAED